jgi:hypothetical protein
VALTSVMLASVVLTNVVLANPTQGAMVWDRCGMQCRGCKSTAPDVRCDTSRHEAGRHAAQVEHEMLPNLMLASPILLDTWILSLVPTTSMVESVGLASVVPGSAVPETCSVMGRHVGAGAQAWADGWAQGMEGEKHGCCMRWVGT